MSSKKIGVLVFSLISASVFATSYQCDPTSSGPNNTFPTQSFTLQINAKSATIYLSKTDAQGVRSNKGVGTIEPKYKPTKYKDFKEYTGFDGISDDGVIVTLLAQDPLTMGKDSGRAVVRYNDEGGATDGQFECKIK